jgi:hypothetical protein
MSEQDAITTEQLVTIARIRAEDNARLAEAVAASLAREAADAEAAAQAAPEQPKPRRARRGR